MRAISAWPGRKTSTPPSVSASAREDQVGHRLLQPGSLPGPPPDQGRSSQRVSTGKARPSAVRIGASPISAATGAASRVADITRSRRSGRSAARTSSASARPRSACSAALVELVEDQAADAGQVRVGLDHPGQDAFGDHLDAAARRPPRRGCGSRRGRPTASPRPSARRSAAARAATRRGSSMTMRPGDAGLEQVERHAGGLAGAGRRLQHGAAGLGQRPAERRQQRLDRQRRARPGGSAPPFEHRPAEAGVGLDALEPAVAVRLLGEDQLERELALAGEAVRLALDAGVVAGAGDGVAVGDSAGRAAAATPASRRTPSASRRRARRAGRSRRIGEAGGDRVERAGLLRRVGRLLARRVRRDADRRAVLPVDGAACGRCAGVFECASKRTGTTVPSPAIVPGGLAVVEEGQQHRRPRRRPRCGSARCRRCRCWVVSSDILPTGIPET